MKVSGFTIARNAIKFGYPIVESISSILPLCDEFIVNVGDCEDDTLKLIRSIDSPKIRVIQNRWDFSQGKEVLSEQTNLALKECSGNWAFYLQSDEVVHERDLPRLRCCMEKYLNDDGTDALRFQWLHFYGSFYRYRIDSGWYQKQDRIIRNNGRVTSIGDAYGFARKDGEPLRRKNTGAFIYHYGWVQDERIMAERRKNAEKIGFVRLSEHERGSNYAYADPKLFPVYFGRHPAVMKKKVEEHRLSREDLKTIRKEYCWNPLFIFKVRYKTFKRFKEKVA